MGLFNLFKKPVLIHDTVFGTVRLRRWKNAGSHYFEGKLHFAPTASVITLLIEAAGDGPTAAQRGFYQNLQTHFTTYAQRMIPLIEDEFRNWKDDFAVADFAKEFALVCLSLPTFEGEACRWQMSFTTVHDLDHQIEIDFVNDEPVSILIDG